MIDGFVKDSRARPHLKSGQVHKRTERAHTLMRDGLKRPAKKFNTSFQRLAAASIEREGRAKNIPKHPNIRRFGIPKPPVKNAATPKTITGELVDRDQVGKSASASHTSAPLPSMITSVSHQKLERLLDQALAHADTHKEALRYGAARHFWQRRWFRGSRLLAVLVLALVVITSGLAISWQKVPQLSVKAAGIRAHLSPTVPSYKPEGYKLAGPAQAVSGTVAIKYTSTDDSRTYEIIQAQSNLTSSLVGQSVIPKGAPVQTSQIEGNTVYIYGNRNDAAWVNNGVLYTIRDHADLSSNELIKIVQGLKP